MKYILKSSLLLSLLIGSGVAMAQDQGNAMSHDSMQGMQMQGMQSGQAMASQANTGVGTVNKVDLQHNKVNLTHGPIKSLGWPGMTMDFTVKDKSLLNGIKPGQKVEFDVVKEGPGQFFIVRITPSK